VILSRLKCVVVAALTVGSVAMSGVAHAAQAAAPAAQAQLAAAEITWTLVRAPNPSQDQSDAYARITAAMNAAAGRYNRLSDLSKAITVYYVPGVPTADGNSNGTIRFGSNRSYMNERTALHETAHTLGVGQSGGWNSLSSGGPWRGAQANALVRQYDGSSAVINTGGGHFWPYGLNYDNEFSQTNADRHVRIVAAMKRDGL
jgi:hypothetical protein